MKNARFWPGRRVLITAGPTREPLDPVRFLTNSSSGKMGFELARAASGLGAHVTVVSGPCERPKLRGVRVLPVVTAEEMRRRVLARCKHADVVIASAAVGDWKFRKVSARKIKKGDRPLRMTLLPNPDIIAEVSRLARMKTRAPNGAARPVLVGFALETDRWLARAKEKMRRKGLDLIVANKPDALGSENARAAILDRCGEVRLLPRMSKSRIAKAILRRVRDLL